VLFPNRRDHLEELIADRKQDVFQPEGCDARVTKRHLEAQDATNLLDDRGERPRDQRNLT
jgi:hypothetical protein